MPELPAYACFVAGSPMFDVIEGNEQSIRMCFVYENAADAGCKDVRPVVVTWGGAAECKWTLDEPDHNAWGSACGHLFGLDDGAPSQNGMTFCCYCGKPLKEIVCVEEDAMPEEPPVG